MWKGFWPSRHYLGWKFSIMWKGGQRKCTCFYKCCIPGCYCYSPLSGLANLSILYRWKWICTHGQPCLAPWPTLPPSLLIFPSSSHVQISPDLSRSLQISHQPMSNVTIISPQQNSLEPRRFMLLLPMTRGQCCILGTPILPLVKNNISGLPRKVFKAAWCI